MAAPSYVFTIARVAKLLGEPEELLHDIAMDMEPEDGCLSVLGLGDVSTVAFTRRGSKTSKSFSPTEKTERHRRCVPRKFSVGLHRGTRRRLTVKHRFGALERDPEADRIRRGNLPNWL